MVKQLIIISFVILPLISLGQYEYTFLQETFFGRQPSARAESMGRAYSSIDGDMSSVFYNPAGIATIPGIELNGSYASPYYFLEKAKYTFISVGYKIKKYLTVGFSRNHFTLGEEASIIGIDGDVIGYSTPKNSNYSLTISSQLIKNLLVGLNANYFIWKPIDKSATAVYFDFGVIKKFQFLQKETSHHSISIGASIKNLNFAKITMDFYGTQIENNLPVITRYGANYQFCLNKHLLFDSLNTFRLLLQGEYQLLLNSDYHSGFHTGAEFKFFEILSLRVGYYNENENDLGLPSANKNEISSFTYGLGLQIPLSKLTKIPLSINFDYISLPQVSYSKTNTNWDNFSTYTLRINLLIKK